VSNRLHAVECQGKARLIMMTKQITRFQATGYASQHIWCLSQARINWEGVPGRASDIKMVGMTEMGAPISLDGVAVHPDCWCVCLCYHHFAAEYPEDGEMYLLVPDHPGCPGQSLETAVKWTRSSAKARFGRPYCPINLILTLSPSLIDF